MAVTGRQGIRGTQPLIYRRIHGNHAKHIRQLDGDGQPVSAAQPVAIVHQVASEQ